MYSGHAEVRQPRWDAGRRSEFLRIRAWQGLASYDLAGSRDNPAGGDPAFALVGQFDLEPVGALPHDLQLGSIFDLVDDTRSDRRPTAHVGRVDGHDGEIF